MNILMLGAPGAGKGTVAQRIHSKFGLTVISTGDLFRTEMENKTELGKKITKVMESGELVPDDLTIELVKKKLKLIKKGFVLDGFPRTIEQAKALDGIVEKRDEKIDFVIFIDTPKDVIIERISGRRICKKCGAIYHLQNVPTKVKGVCDKCGKALYQRDDDKPEVISVRFDEYEIETEPLIKFYTEKGNLHRIDGTIGVKKIMEEVSQILGNKEQK
jgi:adenylate kinase